MPKRKQRKRKLENKSNIIKGVKDMKKILFALLAVAFVVSLCFAQESEDTSVLVSQPAASTSSQSAPPVSQAETKSFTGKVNSVSVGNVDEGTKSQLTVMDDNGQSLSFVIDSGALIADKEGNTLAPIDINNDSKVTVTYTTDTDGTNKAQSIKATE